MSRTTRSPVPMFCFMPQGYAASAVPPADLHHVGKEERIPDLDEK